MARDNTPSILPAGVKKIKNFAGCDKEVPILEIENILADLIRIQTVNPPGDETEVARYLKRLFDEHNIPNEIIEPSPGRGSFIAHLGEGEKSLLFISHTDVVTVSEGWNFAPFSGEIKDGFVHGRGALDCKGLVAAEACAVIQLAHHANFRGRLIFAATADEETGGKLGVRYLIENCPDKIKADFAINEGGRPPLRIGDKTCRFLQTGEKGPAWVRLKTRGLSAHGSLPTLGDNAVVKMAEAIKKLAAHQPKITLIPEVKQLVQKIAELQGFNGEVNEENVDQVINGVEDKTFAAYLTSITRMTVSPNAVSGGTKTNIVPDACEAEIDIRVLPGQDEEYIFEELGRISGKVEMEMMQYQAPTFSTSDSEPYRLVTDGLREFFADDDILPCISAGATDSRFLREAGIPSYGIEMITLNLNPEMIKSVHGKNEKIDIESLRLKSDFLTRVAMRYLRS